MNDQSGSVAYVSKARPGRLVVVAGTGTEVGKTWVAARLAAMWVADGFSVAARKPAQSFDPPSGDAHTAGPATDADLLAAATGEQPQQVCPPHRWYPVAMAPPMAADTLGRDPIVLADLVAEIDRSWPTGGVDLGIVELAGGCWSPHAHDGDGVDLTRALRPDVVLLVADAGLGTINSVRPALRALASIAAVVVLLNRYDPDTELHDRNARWLAERDAAVVATAVDHSLGDLLRGGPR